MKRDTIIFWGCYLGAWALLGIALVRVYSYRF